MDPETLSQDLPESGLEIKGTFSTDIGDRFALYTSSSRRQGSASPADAVFGDSPRDPSDGMGIEDACELNSGWDDEANLAVPVDTSYPMPSSGFNDLTQQTRPETPNLQADFDQLFNSDPNADVVESSPPGVCGLSNLGNTCFMNSGLQCLLNTPPLVQLFLSNPVVKDIATNDTLATHFANLLQKVWSGNYSVVKPTEFQLALANQHAQFKDYRQHDCQEFLALLLGTLHELLNTASAKSHVSDLSADPMTPRSVCEEAVPSSDAVETDSNGQFASNRCEVSSSSSRSSESSLGTSRFRLQAIPEDVKQFNCPSTSRLGNFIMPEDAPDMDVTMGGENCSNLIPDSALKRDPKLVNVAADLNNRQTSISDIIQKDTKTSNVNVLLPDDLPNNQVLFDSDKFPKSETRRRETCDTRNLTASYDFEEKTGSKRMIIGEFDIDATDDTSDYGSLDTSSGYNANSNKRCKFDETHEKEKNEMMERARKLGYVDKCEEGSEMLCEEASVVRSDASAMAEYDDDDIEADKQWEKHTGLNQSVIVDSFQGQFKSTVVCSVCRHSSSTYEPFMYLSVPLPHAMEQQLTVTFVPATADPPTKLLVTLNRQDKVSHLKDQLKMLLCAPETMPLELAQVLDHHIARILDEGQLIRSIACSERSIYAFEISDEVTCVDGNSDSQPLDLTDQVQLNNSEGRRSELESKIPALKNNLLEDTTPAEDPSAQPEPNPSVLDDCDERRCTICLEAETDKPMKNHKGCSLYLCEVCLDPALKHYMGSQGGEDVNEGMSCPVCHVIISIPNDLVDADATHQQQVATRIINVPVLFREDINCEESDLKRHELVGHPRLIRVTNRIAAPALHNLIARLAPYPIDSFSLLLVDGQGLHCSRCMFNAKCRGCPLPRFGEITLRSADNLAVNFPSTSIMGPLIEHESLHNLRKNEDLSIYDCLSAFCESEKLDEHNPWFCPNCQCNRRATKTLTVWRYPEYLIVYLKRFVFYEYTSVKLDNRVSFPLTDLQLPSNNPDISLNFDLYACVNHIGGASAGHYTAFAKNPESNAWHLFNDEGVIPQKPEENDFSDAYILFYQAQKDGMRQTSPILLPCLPPSAAKGRAEEFSFDFPPPESTSIVEDLP